MSALLRLVKRGAFQRVRGSASSCLGGLVNRSDMEGILFSTGTTFQIAIIDKCSERFWSITV